MAAFVVLCSGCGKGSEVAASQACAPGDQKACACGGGLEGAQVCKDDGSGWGPCINCPASGGTGGVAGGGTGGVAGGGGSAGPSAGGGGSGGSSAGGGGSAGAAGASGAAGAGGVGGADASAGGAGSGGAAGASGAAGADGGTAVPGHGVPVTNVAPISAADACATQTSQAALGLLDMLIVQDSTGSMMDATYAGPSKWTMITDALGTFVNDPASAGIGAGIEFFSGSTGDACSAAKYANPPVPIALLPGNASAIMSAIRATTPNGYTPTAPALQGALQYAANWATAHPNHKVVVVLATDGLPNRYANASNTGCSGTGSGVDPVALQKTVDIAAAGAASSIPTYVIGVVSPLDGSLDALNLIAQAGGTGTAFIANIIADPGKQFVAAMNSIREANRSKCALWVPTPPSGQWIDFSRVSVSYTTGDGGAPSALPWSASAAACASTGGFYYDNNSAPTTIELCASTCSKIGADSTAGVQMLLGCTIARDAGAGGGGQDGGPACLLNGQSCQTAASCCSRVCDVAGYCGVML